MVVAGGIGGGGGGGVQTWSVTWLFAEWLPRNTRASLPMISCPSAACHNKKRVAESGLWRLEGPL